MQTVAVLGLGYVGFPLAKLLSETGKYRVLGIDISKEKAETAMKNIGAKGKKFFETPAPQQKGRVREFPALSNVDIAVVCVPTPIHENFQPDYGPVKSACETIARSMKKGALVIIESTVNPGTCEEVALPILEKYGAVSGRDFFLAHCPERIDPGNTRWTLVNIPRNVGGLDSESRRRAAAFYRSFLKAEVRELSTLKAAEATKIVENTFRDINIAYVNELAMSFDSLGIDLVEVIEGAKTKPFAFMAHYPGIGVGGHCIPVDPYYLIERALKSGFEHKFLEMAREVNNGMPAYTARLLEKEMKKLGLSFAKTGIGVLGLAYKKDIEDMRESPALKVLSLLKKKRARVSVYDPFLPKLSTVKNLAALLKKCPVILLATNHTEFQTITAEMLKKAGVKLALDGRNCLPKEKILQAGIAYKGIGR